MRAVVAVVKGPLLRDLNNIVRRDLEIDQDLGRTRASPRGAVGGGDTVEDRAKYFVLVCSPDQPASVAHWSFLLGSLPGHCGYAGQCPNPQR